MDKRIISTFEEAVAYINEIPRFTKKNTMEDTRTFLHRLGDPDQNMRIIHVAGTNGKGSVCAYMRSILEAAGYRTAVFTSPHLVDIRERFVMDGEMVSEKDFLRAFLKIYDLLTPPIPHPTFFEYLFLMAMVLFSDSRPDFCILETGLGGRLDATNAVSHKELAVITRIGLDHTEYLGETMEKIAAEKAGIMQKGAPAVFWDTSGETTKVFQKRAAELGILADSVSKKDYTFLNFKKKSIDFFVNTEYYCYINLTVRTVAAYQMENAALALRAVEILDKGRTVLEEHIRQGIWNCFWAGRMEEVLPEIFVDGAHNQDGIRAFLESVKQDGYEGRRNLLFSAVKDKDYVHMARALDSSGLFEKIAVAPMQTGRGILAQQLRELFGVRAGCRYEMYDNVKEAFCSLADSRRPGERVYVAGSLYLAGEVKELVLQGMKSGVRNQTTKNENCTDGSEFESRPSNIDWYAC